MIQANELRIGNWLECSKEDGYMRVDNIMDEGINFSGDTHHVHSFYPYENLKGILLSPDVLKACGCSGNYPYNLKINDRWNIEFRLSSQPYDRCFLYSLDGDNEMGAPWLMLPHINYLHQLQNLFYLLTGTELNYKV